MVFSKVSQEVGWKIMQGQDLFLQAIIPNKIVLQFPSEVAFLRKELDFLLERFNKKLRELQGKEATQVEVRLNGDGGKKEELTGKQQAILLKKVQDEEKKKGGRSY